MKAANRADFIDLCKKHNKFVNGHYEVFSLSPIVLNQLSQLEIWAKGSLNYYIESAGPKIISP